LGNPALELQQGNLKRAVDGIRTSCRFSESEQWRFEWQRHYTRDEWLDHLPTMGMLTRLAPDQLATVLEAVGTTIDSVGGGFDMEYVTLAVAATRTGDA
jgi:hypothetical protein